jgi:hypothetical protein
MGFHFLPLAALMGSSYDIPTMESRIFFRNVSFSCLLPTIFLDKLIPHQKSTQPNTNYYNRKENAEHESRDSTNFSFPKFLFNWTTVDNDRVVIHGFYSFGVFDGIIL